MDRPIASPVRYRSGLGFSIAMILLYKSKASLFYLIKTMYVVKKNILIQD